MTREGSKIALVTGAGGFIGGHLVARLLQDGYRVHAVDKKSLHDWHQVHEDARNTPGVLVRNLTPNQISLVDEIYHLAADMGGVGFTSTHDADCSLNVLDTARIAQFAEEGQRLFYASSACVYNTDLQRGDSNFSLIEQRDVWPARPDHLYGFEKLYSEELLLAHATDRKFALKIARYHNVYGPHGDWDGGREKAPAAICRKVALARETEQSHIVIWGDGNQARSFMHVDDCVEGTRRIMDSPETDLLPLNLGSDTWVTINDLVEEVSLLAGYQPNELEVNHDFTAPEGVRGRNSDNTLIRSTIGWEPSISLQAGLVDTYAWIRDQVKHGFTI